MEQSLIATMIASLWIIVAYVLYRRFTKGLHLVFLYSRSIGEASNIDTNTDAGKEFVSHVGKFTEGLHRSIRSYHELTSIVFPSVCAAMILWVGLVIQYLFSLNLGNGYYMVSGMFTAFSIYSTTRFVNSQNALLNAMWGLEVFRAGKMAERKRLTALMHETTTFDVEFTDESDPSLVELRKLLLTQATSMLSGTISINDRQIAEMNSEIKLIKQLLK